MLCKTLISIAGKLGMDIDNLMITSLRFSDGYLLDDSKKSYTIVFSELTPVKEPSLIKDYSKTSTTMGVIRNTKTDHEVDLLAFLIKNSII
jgi:hypothetical protein